MIKIRTLSSSREEKHFLVSRGGQPAHITSQSEGEQMGLDRM